MSQGYIPPLSRHDRLGGPPKRPAITPRAHGLTAIQSPSRARRSSRQAAPSPRPAHRTGPAGATRAHPGDGPPAVGWPASGARSPTATATGHHPPTQTAAKPPGKCPRQRPRHSTQDRGDAHSHERPNSAPKTAARTRPCDRQLQTPTKRMSRKPRSVTSRAIQHIRRAWDTSTPVTLTAARQLAGGPTRPLRPRFARRSRRRVRRRASQRRQRHTHRWHRASRL